MLRQDKEQIHEAVEKFDQKPSEIKSDRFSISELSRFTVITFYATEVASSCLYTFKKYQISQSHTEKHSGSDLNCSQV